MSPRTLECPSTYVHVHSLHHWRSNTISRTYCTSNKQKIKNRSFLGGQRQVRGSRRCRIQKDTGNATNMSAHEHVAKPATLFDQYTCYWIALAGKVGMQDQFHRVVMFVASWCTACLKGLSTIKICKKFNSNSTDSVVLHKENEFRNWVGFQHYRSHNKDLENWIATETLR